MNCFGYNEDFSGGERLEESLKGDGRYHISYKRKGNVLSSCICGIYECTRYDGTNRETTGEGPDLPKTT